MVAVFTDVNQNMRRLRELAPGVHDPRAMEQQYEALVEALRRLPPKDDLQQSSQKAALDLAGTISHTRLMMFVETTGKIAAPVLAILILWVATLFLGFGLFARLNPTVAVSFLVGSLCVAAAIFLILELNTPFSGLVQASDAPVRYALFRVGQ